MKYEHKFVHTNEVQDHLDDGWEPVPNVEPVTTYELRTGVTRVFLRRKVSSP